MKNIFLVLIMILFLSGCEQVESSKEISREYRQYELLEIDPPKHVYITIKDIKTGYIWNRLYISKHCNTWRDIPVNSIWGFELVTYENADGSIYEKVENYRDICERVKNGVSFAKY